MKVEMGKTKNDLDILIRQGSLDDAEEMLNIQRAVIMEGEYLITAPEEFDQTIEQQRTWIQSILNKEKETLIIAEVEGKVVGWLVFQSSNLERLSHKGSFSMMLNKEYRDIGIGKLLINELIIWAINHPDIKKVSLGVLSTNQRAIALYTSMGFVEEGRKVKEIKVAENEYIDDLLMYKLV